MAAVLQPAAGGPAIVAGPHDVEEHGRIVIDPVLVALEPAVVPPEAEGQEIDRGIGRELDLAGDVRALAAVSPGADHQPLGRFLGVARAS